MIKRSVMVIVKPIAIAFFISMTTAAVAAPHPHNIVKNYLGALQWREIGPYRGGRVDSVSGVVNRPDVYYFGAADGGVWKTTDAGLHWTGLFQHERVSAVGALAVSRSNPNIIYVGTGEAALRSNISAGNGVYKSTDGGHNWRHVGLDKTRHIGKIWIDPSNPKHVLVAALGSIYKPNKDGGIYLSTDGGSRWNKVLYVNNRTGGIDLVADPMNPKILYAAMWEVWRTPWHLNSGGPGSGIYKSTDGGRTWHHLSGHGLPQGTLGRIGLAVSKNDDGQQVYALIEAKNGGVYRSDDGGKTWQWVNNNQLLRQRPFYFTKIFVNPASPNTVYVLDRGFFKSTDQGEHFALASMQGGDNHDFWVNPVHPRYMIEGNDQGAVISTDGGRSWTIPYNEPIAQMYHVNTDNRYPYELYGEQQDSGSLIIPSMSFSGRICGLTTTVGGGESGYVIPKPGDPNIIFADTYAGQLTRYNRKTKSLKEVSPWPYDSHGEAAAEQKYRFTWIAPLAFSPENPNVLYMGSQVLFKSTDDGNSWKTISPDLSRNDKKKQQLSGGPITKDNASAEYYDLIYSIAPSPVHSGEIWAGTDDGLVWLTRDGGRHWHEVTPSGIPKWSRITMIEASRFKAGSAYIIVDAHKLGIDRPFIFRTEDYGRHWTRITAGLPSNDFVHVVREDSKNPNLLFAGTEHGVYVSFDNGNRWRSLQLDLPTSPVHDLRIHDNDLIAATFGRGYWILDDIAPLRQFSMQIQHQRVHLYKPVTAFRFQIKGGGCPHSIGGARNPPLGGVIDFYLAHPVHSASLNILTEDGTLVRKFAWKSSRSTKAHVSHPHPRHFGALRSVQPRSSSFKPHRGLNRIVWNLRYQPLTKLPGEVFQEAAGIAPMVLPGRYKVELHVGRHTYATQLIVDRSPLAETPSSDLDIQFQFQRKLYRLLSRERHLALLVSRVKKQIGQLDTEFAKSNVPAPFRHKLHAVYVQLNHLNGALWQPQAKGDEELFNYPVGIDQQLAFLDYVVASGYSRPTKASQRVYRILAARYGKLRGRWEHLIREIKSFNAKAHQRDLNLIVLAPPKSTA